MTKILGLIGGAALLAMNAACHSLKSEPTPPPQNLVSYYEGPKDAPAVKRAVLLPIICEDDRAAADEMLSEALASEIGKRSIFEVIAAEARDLEDTDFEATRRTGVYLTKDLITAGRRFGADAILVAVISSFEPPPHMTISLKVSLLDARQGTLRWSTDATFDANERKVVDDVHNFHDTALGQRESLVAYQSILVSPRLFVRYAAERVVETLVAALEPPEKPQKDTPKDP